MSGFVKLPRSITALEVFQDSKLLQLYIWCLTKASYAQQTIQFDSGYRVTPISLKPQSFITSHQSLGRTFGEAPSVMYRRCQALKAQGLIHLHTTNRYSIITIVNQPADMRPPDEKLSKTQYAAYLKTLQLNLEPAKQACIVTAFLHGKLPDTITCSRLQRKFLKYYDDEWK